MTLFLQLKKYKILHCLQHLAVVSIYQPFHLFNDLVTTLWSVAGEQLGQDNFSGEREKRTYQSFSSTKNKN